MGDTAYPVRLIGDDGVQSFSGKADFFSSDGQPCTLRGPFPFAFGTVGLTAGVAIYTPAVGDLIYDIGIQIPTAFNGTTPLADVGTFNGGNDGLFDELAGAAVDLTAADAAVTDNAGLSSPTTTSWLSAAIGSVGAAAGAPFLPGELYVTVAHPLLLVVSQTGAKGGAATGATAGVGAVYLVTGTPVGF